MPEKLPLGTPSSGGDAQVPESAAVGAAEPGDATGAAEGGPAAQDEHEPPTLSASVVMSLAAPASSQLANSASSISRVGIPRVLKNWDRYEVLEILGAGGMGAVYKARDPRLNRFVALKIVHPMLGHAAKTKGEAFVRRFLREARLQASLDHSHICKISARCQSSDGIS